MEGLLTPPAEEFTEAVFRFNNNDQSSQTEVSQDTTVAVIGAGYVGLHLIKTFSRSYNVIAYDINTDRLAELPSHGVHPDVLRTSSPQDLREAQYFLIAVPTGLNHDNTINVEPLKAAVRLINEFACDGATVVIESSVAVGMTRQLLGPMMRARGFRGGMSPERVDPGRAFPTFDMIPKVVSGLNDITKGSVESITALYSTMFRTIIPVSCPEVAEMTKLYENCQRMINVAYANEMADACSHLGIDPLEVSRVAATKPFGYQAYTPSLGVGGHCIPVNPYYLMHSTQFPLLEAAATKMRQRPSRITDRIMHDFKSRKQTDSHQRRVGRPRVLVVGVGFKKGQSSLSNSPGIEVIKRLLDEHEAYVEFCDPLVDQKSLNFVPRLDERMDWCSETIDSRFDIVVVAMDQVGLDFGVLENLDRAVVQDYGNHQKFGVSC